MFVKLLLINRQSCPILFSLLSLLCELRWCYTRQTFFATCLVAIQVAGRIAQCNITWNEHVSQLFCCCNHCKEVEGSSTFCNNPCNAAINFSSVGWRCYTRQRCMQLVSQQCNKIVGQVERIRLPYKIKIKAQKGITDELLNLFTGSILS